MFKKSKKVIPNIDTKFENLYMALYSNHLVEIEKLRKITMWLFISTFLFILLLILVPIAIVKIFSVILFLLSLFLGFFYKRKYVHAYKNDVIKKFIQLFNNKLEYSATTDDFFIQRNYINANFTNEDFTNFYADDYIKGYLDSSTFIRMADIKVQRIVRSGKSSYTVTLFSGIFAFTTSIKNINAQIKISKNNFNILTNSGSVEMDNSIFEKYFDVYSENELLTMRILTHDVMNTLVDFYIKYNLPFEIVLSNNIIYLRFFTGKMFEPKIFGKSLDKDLLFTHYNILNFVMTVSNNINKVLQEIEI